MSLFCHIKCSKIKIDKFVSKDIIFRIQQKGDEMKVIKRILIIILLIIIFIVAGFLYKGHELYKQALEKISISDKVAEIKSDENYTKLEDMSEFYKDAVIAVEDRRFYEHGAIDPIALARAIYSNIKAKELREGGSTITQQLAKNIYFTQEKSA